MRCGRCEGLMVQDDLLDLEDLSGGPWVRAWRCVNCGSIVEDTIGVNRLAGLPGKVGAGAASSKSRTKHSKSRSKQARKQPASCSG